MIKFRALAGCLILLFVAASFAATSPTKYDITAAEKNEIVQWVNTATPEQLASARLSSSAIAKIVAVRPFPNWDIYWATPSAGSDAVAKNVLIKLGKITNLYDRLLTRACLRIRPEDRGRIVTWINNASVSAMIEIKITASGQTKINANRPLRGWEDALMLLSDSDLKKIAIKVGALRYLSGSTEIERISGVGAQYGARFRAQKILSTQMFLMHAVWPSWRTELAAKVGVAEGFITRWAKRADLMRISGCGEQYGDLLAYAGVETVSDLATKEPTALRNQMIALNQQYNLVNTMPSLTTVKGWVAKAKLLPAMVEF